MAPSAVIYPDWKAPREDGEIVIWPQPTELSQQTSDNQKSLAASRIQIQNTPITDLRKSARDWLGHENAQPLIIDGHQTELYHPGVWVKSVLGDALATKLNGRALHLAVDTDAPKHLTLRWPGG